MSEFGERIAEIRRLRGLSALELSDALGGDPTRSTIANWETGRRKDISVREVVAVAKVLGVIPAAICPELDTTYAARLESANLIINDAIESARSRLVTGA